MSLAFIPFERAAIEQSIPRRFAQQVARDPARPAVRARAATLTYGDLDRRSNRLARALVAIAGPGHEPVGLLVEQDCPMAVAILAILKAGRPYMPLDPTFPPPRLASMLDHAGAAALMVDGHHAALGRELTGLHRRFVDLDTAGADHPDAELGLEVGPDALAYLYYTSGSTGRPKGVVDSHRNVLHNIMRYTNNLRISAADRLTLLQAPSFSGAVSSLFSALLNGATVLPYDVRGHGLGRPLGEWLLRERLTIYHSVPMIFRSFLAGDASFPDVRVVRLEGDAASPVDLALFRRHFGPDCILANGLGATETGLSCQFLVTRDADPGPGTLPIGRPTADMEVQLLDDDGRAVTTGEIGEIGVRSQFLALGYWREPELTAAAFRPDPAGAGWRVYRTGDLGRRRPDGNLEYLGRKDFQLKIRGQRVDTGEVERVLRSLPGIGDAVVVTRAEGGGEARLVAYLVPSVTPAPAVSTLRRALADTLPPVMVPSRFVVLETLPLNDNGKVDRRALPTPGDAGHPERSAVREAASDLERELTKAWERVLDVSPIGVEDNFFDLGGDSLLAARLLAELEARLGRTLLPGMLLEAPTVQALAQALGTARPASATGSVIALQPRGALPPLWCVHPHRGDVLTYANLARRLGSERPVYALQGPPAGARPLRMEEIAAGHLEALRRVQPAGPYHLVGYCFGGVMAFEMAQQLTRSGEDVALLALLDLTPADFPTLVRPGALASYLARPGASKSPWARAGRLVEGLHKRAGQERWAYLGTSGAAYVSEHLDEAAWMVAMGGHRLFRRAAPRRLWTTERRSRFAFASYTPEPFAGAVTLLLSEGTTASYSQTPGLDWAGLARADVTVRLVPGEGGAMLKEPHVRVLADALIASLREHRAGGAPA